MPSTHTRTRDTTADAEGNALLLLHANDGSTCCRPGQRESYWLFDSAVEQVEFKNLVLVVAWIHAVFPYRTPEKRQPLLPANGYTITRWEAKKPLRCPACCCGSTHTLRYEIRTDDSNQELSAGVQLSRMGPVMAVYVVTDSGLIG